MRPTWKRPKMQPSVKLLRFDSLADYWVQDFIPAPGEVLYCLIPETDEQGIKIGDGQKKFNELPLMKEIPMHIDYEFGAPWINKMINHIPEEVWKRAEKTIKERKSIYHASDVIVEAVRILSEEYYNL